MKRSTQISLTVLTSLTVATTSEAMEPTRDSFETMKKNVVDKKAVMVDVREQRETNDGYIDGAVLVPLSLLTERSKADDFAAELAQRIAPKTIVYLYCRSGRRSFVAAELFDKFDYDVRPLKQGFGDLVRGGFVATRPKGSSVRATGR